MNKTKHFLLWLLLLCSLFAYAGDGTSASTPLTIDNLEDLCAFRDALNASPYKYKDVTLTDGGKGLYFAITSDIDMAPHCHPAGGAYATEVHWVDIKTFKGSLDGQNHTLKNCYQGLKNLYYAFFQKVYGKIENLNFENAIRVSQGASGRAILVQILQNGAEINNCRLQGTFVMNSNVYIGTFAAICEGGTIKYCTNEVNIITSANQTNRIMGGIVGSLTNNGKVIGCVNQADSILAKGIVGGIVGYASHSIIDSCHNCATVCGIDAYDAIYMKKHPDIATIGFRGFVLGNTGNPDSNPAGGIVGYMVDSCYVGHSLNTGNIRSGVAGGIVGGIKDTIYAGSVGDKYATIEQCQNIGTINGNLARGGIVGLIDGSMQRVANNLNAGLLRGKYAVKSYPYLYVGGIIGLVVRCSGMALNDNLNVGEIWDDHSYVGAILGFTSTSDAITLTDNYYDKQMVPFGGMANADVAGVNAKRTDELLGTTFTLNTTHWEAQTGRYPKLKNNDTDASDVATAPIQLYHQTNFGESILRVCWPLTLGGQNVKYSYGTGESVLGFAEGAGAYQPQDILTPIFINSVDTILVQNDNMCGARMVLLQTILAKSYTVYTTVPTGATSVTISSDGLDNSYLIGRSFAVQGGQVFRYTQALPGTIYSFTFDNASADVMPTQAAPTFTDTWSTIATSNIHLPKTANVTSTTVAQIENLRLDMTPAQADAYNEGAQLQVKNTLGVADGLAVEVDLNNFLFKKSDNYAYVALPFDVDLRTGVRFTAVDATTAGKDAAHPNRSERIAQPDLDYDIFLYSSESRSQRGEGTGNWTAITQLPNPRLLDGYVLEAGTGFLMKILDQADYTLAWKNAHAAYNYEVNGGPVDNKYRFYALQPDSLGASSNLHVEAVNNGAKSSTNHASFPATDWRYGWDDGLVFIGMPFTSSYSVSTGSGVPKWLYYRLANGSNRGGYEVVDVSSGKVPAYNPYFAWINTSGKETQTIGFKGYNNLLASGAKAPAYENDAPTDRFLFNLTRNGSYTDKVGIYFNDDASNTFSYVEDAIKMGTGGTDIMWNSYNGNSYAYNVLPFEGDSMAFTLNVCTQKEGNYRLLSPPDVPADYSVYVSEPGGARHDLLASDYPIAARGMVPLTVEIEKIWQTPTAVDQTQHNGMQLFGMLGKVRLTNMEAGQQISLYNVAGQLLYCQKVTTAAMDINGLPAGIYLVHVNNGTVGRVVVK